MKGLNLEKSIIFITMINHDGFNIKDVEPIILEPKSDILKIKENIEEIEDTLYYLSTLTPTQSLYKTTFIDGKQVTTEQIYENPDYIKRLNRYFTFLKDFPEFMEITTKLREKFSEKMFVGLGVYIIDNIYCSDDDKNNQKYLLNYVGREYGGAGCGGDCLYDNKPILLNINEDDYNFLLGLKPVKTGMNEDELISNMKSQNFPEFLINEILERYHEEDGDFYLGDRTEFVLTKL